MTPDDYTGPDCSTCGDSRVLTVDASGLPTERRDEPTTTVRCPDCSAAANDLDDPWAAAGDDDGEGTF